MSASCPRCGKTFAGPSIGTHSTKCGVQWQELYWQKVDKAGAGGCWLWTGALEGKGYGHFRAGRTDRRAHHVALELAGVTVPKGLEGMHTCDVRNCVNPAHLQIGTHEQNMADMAAKGRQARGVMTKRNKLTEEQALYVKAHYRKTAARKGNGSVIAKELGVSPSAVYAIGRGDAWTHLK